MKKILIKAAVFVAVFLVSLIVVGRFMNRGHDNITMEMAEAVFPVIVMERNGLDYNELHGYAHTMNTAFQRDVVTVLGENRDTSFTVETFGTGVEGISMEVRSVDGSRLIEEGPIADYTEYGGTISARVALKDLIEKDTEYMLALILTLEDEREIYYYTRVIWSDSLFVDEKLAFVADFHERLYDRERAKELTRYLETNAQLQDNRSFHYVNIHSSFRQITWGDLAVTEETEPRIQLKEIAGQTATLLVDYVVSSSEGKSKVFYQTQEYYQIRYTPDRIYLLDYERNMTQIPEPDRMYANDKILLGITGTDIPIWESGDGNILVFQVADRLFCYHAGNNRLTSIFSFYDEKHADIRTLYANHAIKILDVDEGGNVQFVVYGYMNRGRHEGEVGIQLYSYDSSLNTIEEIVYIPVRVSYAVLDAEMQQLLHLNRNQKLYLTLDSKVYCIDLEERNYSVLVDAAWDGAIQVSDNHKILVSLNGENQADSYHCTGITIHNLNSESRQVITVASDETIRPLGFMGEDIIYGVARQEDIIEENSGRVFFPMYKVCICNADGRLLKEYEQPGMYVTGCTVEDNQITLERWTKSENGVYTESTKDQIMNNEEEETGVNAIVTANIDIYESYVQIQTKKEIDSKTIQLLNPREVVFEGGRELQLPVSDSDERYFVYSPYGVSGIFHSPATAVSEAYPLFGRVVDGDGNCVWLRGNRVARNQIMAIRETSAAEGQSSLAVCLDTILKFEGISSNSAYQLKQGKTVKEILEDNLENTRALDLTGCSLDSILYYVNQDIPVLVLLKNGEAVLVTGFNDRQVVILEPSRSRDTLYKMSMTDAAEWFTENGNSFMTYIRR